MSWTLPKSVVQETLDQACRVKKVQDDTWVIMGVAGWSIRTSISSTYFGKNLTRAQTCDSSTIIVVHIFVYQRGLQVVRTCKHLGTLLAVPDGGSPGPSLSSMCRSCVPGGGRCHTFTTTKGVIYTPAYNNHGSGWHGPLDDHFPLQIGGFPLP